MAQTRGLGAGDRQRHSGRPAAGRPSPVTTGHHPSDRPAGRDGQFGGAIPGGIQPPAPAPCSATSVPVPKAPWDVFPSTWRSKPPAPSWLATGTPEQALGGRYSGWTQPPAPAPCSATSVPVPKAPWEVTLAGIADRGIGYHPGERPRCRDGQFRGPASGWTRGPVSAPCSATSATLPKALWELTPMAWCSKPPAPFWSATSRPERMHEGRCSG